MKIEDDFNKQELIEIIKLYYDYENIEINKTLFLSIAKHIEEIKENKDAFYKSFRKPNQISERSINKSIKNIYFLLDFNEIKSNFPDFFFFLIKYLSEFAEDLLIYIKITLHYHFFSNYTNCPLIQIEFMNLPEIFSNVKSLKVNSLIELNGRIRRISSCFQKNSKVRIIYPNIKEGFHETFQVKFKIKKINNKKQNFYAEEYCYTEYYDTKLIRYIMYN